MNKLPRYTGSFWSFLELRDYFRKQVANIPNLELKRDDSNQKRLDKKNELERKLKRDIPYPANGDAKLRGIKGNNGAKLIKRFSY